MFLYIGWIRLPTATCARIKAWRCSNAKLLCSNGPTGSAGPTPRRSTWGRSCATKPAASANDAAACEFSAVLIYEFWSFILVVLIMLNVPLCFRWFQEGACIVIHLVALFRKLHILVVCSQQDVVCLFQLWLHPLPMLHLKNKGR